MCFFSNFFMLAFNYCAYFNEHDSYRNCLIDSADLGNLPHSIPLSFVPLYLPRNLSINWWDPINSIRKLSVSENHRVALVHFFFLLSFSLCLSSSVLVSPLCLLQFAFSIVSISTIWWWWWPILFSPSSFQYYWLRVLLKQRIVTLSEGRVGVISKSLQTIFIRFLSCLCWGFFSRIFFCFVLQALLESFRSRN